MSGRDQRPTGPEKKSIPFGSADRPGALPPEPDQPAPQDTPKAEEPTKQNDEAADGES